MNFLRAQDENRSFVNVVADRLVARSIVTPWWTPTIIVLL